MPWSLLTTMRILVAITLIKNLPMIRAGAVTAEISTAYENENAINDQIPLNEKLAWKTFGNTLRSNRIPWTDENLGYATLNKKRYWKNLQSSWEKPSQSVNHESLYAINPESMWQMAYLTNAAILDGLINELNSSENVDDTHNNMLGEKRSWKALNVAWGKRRNAPTWNKFRGAWGKREPNWNNLKGVWGKR